MAEDERAPKRWQAPSAAKRAVERYWLGYTVVWGGVAGSVMLTGLAEGWGDVELMALGVAFALGTVVPPIARPHASEADVPWYQRTATKMSAGVVSFALLMNYVCTPYFFEVLHMRYGFRATWVIEQNPI